MYHKLNELEVVLDGVGVCALSCIHPASITLNCNPNAIKKTNPKLITSKALSATMVPTIFSAGTFSRLMSMRTSTEKSS